MPRNGAPIDKFGILATSFTGYWKSDYCCSTHPRLLEITADKYLVESEVFVFCDVPQIPIHTFVVLVEELGWWFELLAGL